MALAWCHGLHRGPRALRLVGCQWCLLVFNAPAQDRVTLTAETIAARRSCYSTCVARRGTTEVVIPVSFYPTLSVCTYMGDPASMRDRVSGIVLDSHDAPMSGVVLEIRDSEGVMHWKGRSASDGSFDFADLSEGDFTLHLTKRDYLAQSVDFTVGYCIPDAWLQPRLGPRCK